MNENLLDRIEAALFDNTPIEDLLRMVIVYGGRMKDDDLIGWATGELNGYSEGKVPEYRVKHLALRYQTTIGNSLMTGIQTIHEPVELYELGHYLDESLYKSLVAKYEKGVAIADSIAKLSSFLQHNASSGAKVCLQLPGSAYIAQQINIETDNPLRNVEMVYWELDNANIADIIDRVKTTLAQFVSKLRELQPDEQVYPTSEMVKQATTTIIIAGNVDNSSVVGNMADSCLLSIVASDSASLETALKIFGVNDDSLEALIGEVAVSETEMKKTTSTKPVSEWIKKAAETVSGVTADVATSVITSAIMKYLDIA
jgi:hypothetical protein